MTDVAWGRVRHRTFRPKSYVRRRTFALVTLAAVMLLLGVLVVKGVTVFQERIATYQPAALSAVTTDEGSSDGREGRPLVLVSGRPVFPLVQGQTLPGEEKSPVMVQGAPVQSIVPGVGFWLGASPDQRFFVQASGETVDLDALKPGERLLVTGETANTPSDVVLWHLTDEDANRLTEQERIVVANNVRLYP